MKHQKVSDYFQKRKFIYISIKHQGKLYFLYNSFSHPLLLLIIINYYPPRSFSPDQNREIKFRFYYTYYQHVHFSFRMILEKKNVMEEECCTDIIQDQIKHLMLPNFIG